jgi:hypothetical protein
MCEFMQDSSPALAAAIGRWFLSTFCFPFVSSEIIMDRRGVLLPMLRHSNRAGVKERVEVCAIPP